MRLRWLLRGGFISLLALSLASCGGGSSDGGAPGGSTGGGTTGGSTSGGSSGGTTTASNLPPAPFGITATTQFALVGWQESSSEGHDTTYKLASEAAQFAWSADAKTYTATIGDIGSGRLVLTFPGNNPAAFSLVDAGGATVSQNLTVLTGFPHMGDLYWQSPNNVPTPVSIYAHAIFGIPTSATGLPATGRRVFSSDASTQSWLVIDLATRKVSGSFSTRYVDGWYPDGPMERGVIDPVDLQADGSFVAKVAVANAPYQGELYGRLMGPSGDELAVYWNGPVRPPFDSPWTQWRAVSGLMNCASCAP